MPAAPRTPTCGNVEFSKPPVEGVGGVLGGLVAVSPRTAQATWRNSEWVVNVVSPRIICGTRPDVVSVRWLRLTTACWRMSLHRRQSRILLWITAAIVADQGPEKDGEPPHGQATPVESNQRAHRSPRQLMGHGDRVRSIDMGRRRHRQHRRANLPLIPGHAASSHVPIVAADPTLGPQ